MKKPKAADVKVQGITFPDEKDGLTIRATHPGFAVLAAECVTMFKEYGAINFLEWTMQSGDPAFGEFTLIIQRKDGKTGAERFTEVAKELAAVKLQLGAMIEERDLYSDVVDAAEKWLKHHGTAALSEAEANKALRYQVERLGERIQAKPVEDPQRLCNHGGVFRGEACPKCGADVR